MELFEYTCPLGRAALLEHYCQGSPALELINGFLSDLLQEGCIVFGDSLVTGIEGPITEVS